MDQAHLTAHPRKGKWSIIEIVEHLVLAEADVFGDLTALDTLPERQRTPRHRLRYWIVMFVLRFDIPVRAPSRAMLPGGDVALDELRRRWEAQHELLRAWITVADRAALAAPRFVHPIAGPMDTTKALRMLEVHLDRHIRQIDGLVRRLSPLA